MSIELREYEHKKRKKQMSRKYTKAVLGRKLRTNLESDEMSTVQIGRFRLGILSV